MSNSEDNYHKKNLKSKLLKTAEKIIDTQGSQALSIRGLTKESGVTPMAFYSYFQNLDELLTILAHKYLQVMEDTYYKQTKNVPFAITKFRMMGYMFVDYAIKHPNRFRIMYGQPVAETFQSSPKDEIFFRSLIKVIYEIKPSIGEEQALINGIMAWSTVQGLTDLIVSGALKDIYKTRAEMDVFIKKVVDKIIID